MPTVFPCRTLLRHLCLAAMLAAALVLVPALVDPAAAQTLPRGAQEGPATAPSWLTSFYKALSYEAITGYLHLSDMAAHPPYWVTRGYLGLDAASSLATFYAHELAWNALGPAPGTESVAAVGMAKAITFRALDVVRGFAVALSFTGDPLAASGIATAQVLTDTSVYLLNEYGWTLFGPQPPAAVPPAPATVAVR